MKQIFQKLSKNKTWVVFLILALVFFPKAFYLEAESDTRAIITAVGIDKQEDEYEVSSLMVVPSSTTDPGSNLHLVSTKGKTVGDAFNQLSYNLGKRVGLAHCDFIVVNDDVLEDDITRTIDFFVRQYNITKRAYLVNCSGGAKKMLETALNEKGLSSVLLTNLVQKENHSTMGVGSNIDDIYKMYFSQSGVTYLNVFDLESEEKGSDNANESSSSGSQGATEEQNDASSGSQGDGKEKIKGTERLVMLKKGVKTCEIDSDETLFFEIFSHSLRSTYMLIEDVSDEDKQNADVGVDIIKIHSKNKYYFDDDKPTIKCDITLVVALFEVCDDKTTVEQMDNAKTHISDQIKGKIRDKIENGAKSVLQKCRENNIDILGYANKFSKRNYNKWRDYLASLGDEEQYLQNCEIVFDIKIQDKF